MHLASFIRGNLSCPSYSPTLQFGLDNCPFFFLIPSSLSFEEFWAEQIITRNIVFPDPDHLRSPMFRSCGRQGLESPLRAGPRVMCLNGIFDGEGHCLSSGYIHLSRFDLSINSACFP